MNKSPFRHDLETYLREKERRGEKLPGVRGRVNYRGIAIEIGIPESKFKPGSELRLRVDALIDRLGVLDGRLFDQPRRELESKRGTSSTSYGDLVTSGDPWLREHGYAETSIRSYKSHLKAFKQHFGRNDESLAVEDFGVDFERRLVTFLKATGKGKAVASALRLWARIYYELFQSTSLPSSFPAALNELVIKSGRKRRDIARAAGITPPDLLGDWVKGDSKPKDPDQVARLEVVLNVSSGTLGSKLVLSRVRHATIIPKEWWPDSWQNSFSNYHYQRDKVIALIPDHLLLGPLETLAPVFDDALERVLKGEGELAYRQKLKGFREKAYFLKIKDWPDHLKSEFVMLKAYKMAPSGLGNTKRRGQWVEKSGEIVRLQLESFFGFLCLPADHPDPELRGLGLPVESLTLAWLASQDEVIKYLDFRRLRSGAHSTGTESFINTWVAMLRPEGGWLWLHPELLERLPEPLQQKVSTAGGWRSYCEAVALALKDSLKSLKSKGQMKQTRKPMQAIKPILGHDEPLSLIDAALRLTEQELEARSRPNEKVGQKLAAARRDYLCFSIMARFPLRAKHWGRFTYREDGSGDLQNHPTYGWQLRIPHADFKNSRNQKVFPSDSESEDEILFLRFSDLEPLRQLIPELERYLKEFRPIIAGEGDFLFPTMNGTAMSERALYNQFSRWTRKYLSQHSNKPTAIKGVHPFGPHAMRDIVATHIIKTTGSISLAANILLDSEETVRNHYIRFLPKDRIGLAMAKLTGAFKTKEDEEEEV